MKPSNEEKARFLRTCIGEYILSPGEGVIDMQWLIHSVDLDGNVWVVHEKDNERVLLDDPDRLGPHEMSELNDIAVVKTSLSSISDEDAIEVGKRCYPNINNSTRQWLLNTGVRESARGSYMTAVASDYLRSKSYALPYNGYTVDQLQEFGWIKLKE